MKRSAILLSMNIVERKLNVSEVSPGDLLCLCVKKDSLYFVHKVQRGRVNTEIHLQHMGQKEIKVNSFVYSNDSIVGFFLVQKA